MATTNPKTPARSGATEAAKPTSHAEHVAQHQAREATIRAACASEVEALERDKTRALTAEAKALAVAAAEFEAESAKRHEEAMLVVWDSLISPVQRYVTERTHEAATKVAAAFRSAEAHLLHVENRTLTRELGVAIANTVIARVPEAIEIFGQLDVWNGMAGPDGIPLTLRDANGAMRDEFALSKHLEVLLRLESALTKRATAQWGGRLTPEEAPRYWAIVCACHAPAQEDAAFKLLAAEAKAKAIAHTQAEQNLALRAVQGDEDARRELLARGPGVLDATLKLGASILKSAGFSG